MTKEERVIAAAESAWRRIVRMRVAGHNGCDEYAPHNCALYAVILAAIREHFGAPDTLPLPDVARIYADDRWIHAECFLCSWAGVRWKVRKGSGLPNAKSVLQHALRDHLLSAHVGNGAAKVESPGPHTVFVQSCINLKMPHWCDAPHRADRRTNHSVEKR